MNGVRGHAAEATVLVAAAIVAVGLLRAVAARGAAAAVTFGGALSLALEFLLAGGLIRLSGLSLPGLGAVAVVVVVRQVIARGIRFAERAVAAPVPLSPPTGRSPAGR